MLHSAIISHNFTTEKITTRRKCNRLHGTMKTLLVIFLVAACSAAKLSSNHKAPSDALSSGGGDYLSVTATNEYLSDEELETSSSRRFGKKLNATSTEQTSQSYTTHYPYKQSYTTPSIKHYFSPVTEASTPQNVYVNGQSNQQYIPPIEDKKSFDVIPQERQTLNLQYLPPINNENISQFYSDASVQQPSTQYLPSSQFRQSTPTNYYSNQFEPQYFQSNNIQQNTETYPQQVKSYYNSQPSQHTSSIENQSPIQYSSQPFSNNLEKQYYDSSNFAQIQYQPRSYSQINSNDFPESNQNSEAENHRTPKEHIPSSRSDIYSVEENYNGQPSSFENRRYDMSTSPPTMQYNYQYNPVSTPSPYISNYITRDNYSNYNQYQDTNSYQTTQPTVEIGQSTNLPKWLNYSPSFVSRQENHESTSAPIVQQQAQPRQSLAYGEKLYQQSIQQPHQAFFASARSSNLGPPLTSTTTTTTTQAPDRYAEAQSIDRPRFVPQTPSQFKPAPPIIKNELYLNPYVQQQPQPYAKTYQYPNQYPNYQPGPTTEPMPVLKQMNEMDINGNYIYETLTGDQTHIMQQGHIENKGTDHEEQVMEGSYSFVGDDGKTYTVTYIADSHGFRATGEHLPTAPPIPEVIQRAIELNLAEEAAEAAQAAQTPQRYQYPQPDSNNRYPVVEQARERSSVPHIPNYDNGYKY